MRAFILKTFTDDEAETCLRCNMQEIVRCKECGFAFYKEGLVQEGYIFCTKPGTERGQAVKPDEWFCADGVATRKVGEEK